jgi:hypothetical protein
MKVIIDTKLSNVNTPHPPNIWLKLFIDLSRKKIVTTEAEKTLAFRCIPICWISNAHLRYYFSFFYRNGNIQTISSKVSNNKVCPRGQSAIFFK